MTSVTVGQNVTADATQHDSASLGGKHCQLRFVQVSTWQGGMLLFSPVFIQHVPHFNDIVSLVSQADTTSISKFFKGHQYSLLHIALHQLRSSCLCLSVTCQHCAKTTQARIMTSLLTDSQRTPVLVAISTNLKGFTLSNSLGFYAFYCTKHAHFWATRKIWMKIDPHYQRQKHSPMTIFWQYAVYADILGGSLDRGVKRQKGLLMTAIFSIIAGYFFGNFTHKARIITQRYAVLIGFSVIPKCRTLNDPECLFRVKFFSCWYVWIADMHSKCRKDASFAVHHKNLNEDRPILSAAKM